jgi:hypothetical protein
MQPTYWPWMGYFDLIDQSDIFVIYDDVQFQKQSWQCRNRIKASQGEQYLTITVKKSPLGTPINQVELNNQSKWYRKHLNALKLNYSKTEFYPEVFPFIEPYLQGEMLFLVEVTSQLIKTICHQIGIRTSIISSSELSVPNSIPRDRRPIEICKLLNCNQYISTPGSATYINEKSAGGLFVGSPVQLSYHNYVHPIYPQLHGEFVPYMGIIDLLCNVGFKQSLEYIRKGRKQLYNFDEI